MQKFVRALLILLICIGSLGAIYVGFVFLMASGFIFAGDIDLTVEQRSPAKVRVYAGKVFGLLLMMFSPFVMLSSGVISNKILKIFRRNI